MDIIFNTTRKKILPINLTKKKCLLTWNKLRFQYIFHFISNRNKGDQIYQINACEFLTNNYIVAETQSMSIHPLSWLVKNTKWNIRYVDKKSKICEVEGIKVFKISKRSKIFNYKVALRSSNSNLVKRESWIHANNKMDLTIKPEFNSRMHIWFIWTKNNNFIEKL